MPLKTFTRRKPRLASLGGAAALVGVIATLRVANDFHAAASDESTYVIPKAEATYQPDTSQARITFKYQWADDSYPGQADCKIDLIGTKGESVGSTIVSLESLTPSPGVVANLEVDVSGEPTTATGT